MNREAKALIVPVRQRSQYTCMAASMMMCLKANGLETNEDEVNKVMGAKPMQGASWEQAQACAQHFGLRTTMIVPATLGQVKAWTDRGIPVMIAWNPEGRPWSHASVVFDVTDDGMVKVADPNIPDPDETVRIVTKDEFYHKWFEKWPDYLVRRPAMAVDREISLDGMQRVAKGGRSTYDAKDMKRIDDMAAKAGGDKWKMKDLARQMANSITDADKAFRRGRAAEEENYHDIADIFFARGRQLDKGKKASMSRTGDPVKTMTQPLSLRPDYGSILRVAAAYMARLKASKEF